MIAAWNPDTCGSNSKEVGKQDHINYLIQVAAKHNYRVEMSKVRQCLCSAMRLQRRFRFRRASVASRTPHMTQS